MARRCGRPDVEATVRTVTGPGGQQLWTGTVGTGGTVAVLLHQSDRTASCGWWPFANQLAAQGVRAVMLDFCGYGQSRCDPSEPWTTDYVDQAKRAVAQVRADGATRVTLVGASLGGTVATLSAAGSGADAVVNLSGFGFGPLATAPALSALTLPVLGAGSHTEETESRALEAEVQAAPTRAKRFVWDTAGHGWSLVLVGPQPDSPLTDVGRTVIAWTKGDYQG
jgi:alpha-beta hydrolase superfamily lysophospholipase